MKVKIKDGHHSYKIEADAIVLCAQNGDDVSDYTKGRLSATKWASILSRFNNIVKVLRSEPFNSSSPLCSAAGMPASSISGRGKCGSAQSTPRTTRCSRSKRRSRRQRHESV